METHEHDHDHEHGSGMVHTHLTSVGIDIGSSTSHLMFSQLTVGYRAAHRRRPEVLERRVIARSPIRLTPFGADWNLQEQPLNELIETTFRDAGLERADIDTGAVIVTGEAARRDNAAKIAALFAQEAGRFVCATAGPRLEAILAAHGSGAVARSREQGSVIVNVDVGGGTTKISVIRSGAIEATTALNIGARLIAWDERGSVVRLEKGGRRFLSDFRLPIEVGSKIDETVLKPLARRMTEVLFGTLDGEPPGLDELFITPPIQNVPRIDEIVFSGGVSEYVYGREANAFGDLGPLLGNELRAHAARRGYAVADSTEGIRATVIGASQYTIQLSGETIFIPEPSALPIRNLRVFVVRATWEPPIAENSARLIQAALGDRDPEVRDSPFALYVATPPFLGYGAAHELAQGIRAALLSASAEDRPKLLVFEQNVGHIIGQALPPELAIPCIDEIALSELDFIDVGEFVAGESYVPVVIKSLAFGV
ncbi:MAG TPA: ethanolamine ammonia-lyase reactivating factor EutA [Candidatus Acidoferrales bacterium]|nr:ethanolamine ammonia-lyase reactivating factor EutA [Candidatus Acidoferrales bacterium]